MTSSQSDVSVPGPIANWSSGTGAPSNAQGSNGDWYIDNATGNCYTKQNGTWQSQFSMVGATGSAGVSGNPLRLARLNSANLNTTADQAMSVVGGVTKYAVTAVIVSNVSTNISGGLAAGGIYTATSKGGTAIIPLTQVYTALTGATVALALTLGAGIVSLVLSAATLYLSLTTANGTAATADVHVFGYDLT